MKNKTSQGNRKVKMSDKEFYKALRDAHKNPQFLKDIKKFIKITTGTYKLKDYGMEKVGLE
jgi:hypothetical protein